MLVAGWGLVCEIEVWKVDGFLRENNNDNMVDVFYFILFYFFIYIHRVIL